MEPFKTLTSRTVVLPEANIDTDQIIPARFLTTTTKAGLGREAFYDWRYDAAGNVKGECILNAVDAAEHRVLVGGRNFGCGSSREHAPWALTDFGFRAVISTEIADIFTSNALKNGLLPIVVDKETHVRLLEHPGEPVTIDLQANELRMGNHVVRFSVEPFSRECLLDGVDTLGWLTARIPAIEAFEKAHAAVSSHSIVLLPGDGVGPEVTRAVRTVLDAVAARGGHSFAFAEHRIGGVAIDELGEPLPDATREACLAADAVFLGAVGGPKWDLQPKRPEQGLLAIRKAMGLFANLRPTTVDAPLVARSPLKAEAVADVDLLIVRELTGGVYFGERTRTDTTASDLCTYSVEEVERVARIAFEAARGRRGLVTSVDKANVMETSRLWRETVIRLHRDSYADVTLEHQLVDSMAMKLITGPGRFDVVLTENMFGDILSDEASVLAGSIGLLGSASLGAGGPGLFEPIHGSAPDIAGQDKANPIGAIRSAAMLLRYGLKLAAEADAVERAAAESIAAGELTGDLGGTLGTQAVAGKIAARL